MPNYDYDCPACGTFTAMRPLAMYDAPTECPACGASAPRLLMAAPQLGAGTGAPPAEARTPHRGGCPCCAPGGRLMADAPPCQGMSACPFPAGA
jgi:putative FmdB family regulatory protein